MDNIKPQLLVIIGIWVGAVVLLLNVALGLVSSPSTIGVFVGSLILIAVAAIHVPLAMKYSKIIVDFLKLSLILFFLINLNGCAWKRIAPGYVGIKVDLYGGGKGVEAQPLGVGIVWYNPWTTTIYEFPNFVQTAVWSKSLEEGHPTNEELSFNTQEGMVITADLSLSYHLEASKTPDFFQKFRTDDLNAFTHGFLRNVARDAFNEVAVQYTFEQIYGVKKEEFLSKVRARINKETADYGIVLEQFGLIGAPRPPEEVKKSLNAKMQATQDAIRVENELRQTQAEAQKKIAAANGEAQSLLAIAKAQADANKQIAASLTPELVQWEAIHRWNGQRPMVEGNSAGLLMQLPQVASKNANPVIP